MQRSRVPLPRDGTGPDTNWAALQVSTQGLRRSRFPQDAEGDGDRGESNWAALEAAAPARIPGNTPLARACAEAEAEAEAETEAAVEAEEEERAMGRHAVAWTLEEEDWAGAKAKGIASAEQDVSCRPSTAPAAPAAARPPTISISARPPTWRRPPPPWPPLPSCVTSARPMTASEWWHQRDDHLKPAAGSPLGRIGAPPPQLLGRPTAPTALANVAARPIRAPLRPRPQAAWGDVRPPPDSHQPWRSMLLGAHWSHYMD